MIVNNNPIIFYSIINGNKYAIQGLESFANEQQVSLGFDTQLFPRVLTVGIHKTEGILNDVNIYIKDNLLNIMHDLKVSDYEFDHQENGDNKNRFTLVLTQQGAVLDVDEALIKKDFIVFSNDNNIRIESSKIVQNVKIYNVLGEILIDSNPLTKEADLQNDHIIKGSVLIVNAIFEDGTTASRKFIHY